MNINELKGANMDIDFSNPDFGNSKCPWNESENTTKHKCAVKNTSICKYFCGIKYMDSVICSYPYENSDVLKVNAPIELILSAPNSVTAAVIVEGRRIAHDDIVKGYTNIEDLKKAIDEE